MNEEAEADLLEEHIEAQIEEEVTEEPVETLEGEESESEPKQSRSQNAKQRLRRKLREADDRNTQLADQIKAQNERQDALDKKLEGVINPPAERPTRVDFDTEEEYEDALYDFRKPSQPQPEAQVPAQAPQQDFVAPDVRENWNEQMDNGHDKYDDFHETVHNKDLRMTDPMTFAVMESDVGGDIAYFLGKNPAEADRISRLTVTAQVREIDKLSNKFTTSTSSAPTPISQAKSGSTTSKDPEKMSTDEYRKMRQEQRANKR